MKQPERFVFFRGFIVTANRDLSIPINSRVVAQVIDGDYDSDLLQELLDRANQFAESREPQDMVRA